MAFSQKKPDAYRDQIRTGFKSRIVQNPNKRLQWGQFLDNPNGPSQVGIYGTSAGLLALVLGGLPVDTMATHVRNTLIADWNGRANDPVAAANYEQNIKLAWFLLSIGAQNPISDQAVQAVLSELLGRILPQEDLWADAVRAIPTHTPSEYSSAIILILLCAFKALLTPFPGTVAALDTACSKAATALQTKYTNDPEKPRGYKLAMLLAIVLHLPKPKSVVSSHLRQVLSKTPDLSSRYTYFYDQEKANGEFIRDYFILPTQLFSPFLLFKEKITGTEYFLARRTLDALEECLKMNAAGLYQEGVPRISSLEQGFVALALHGANVNPPSFWKLVLPWFRYKSRQKEVRSRFYGIVVLFGVYAPLLLMSAGTQLSDALQGTIFLEEGHFWTGAAQGCMWFFKRMSEFPALVLALAAGLQKFFDPEKIYKSIIYGKRKK